MFQSTSEDESTLMNKSKYTLEDFHRAVKKLNCITVDADSYSSNKIEESSNNFKVEALDIPCNINPNQLENSKEKINHKFTNPFKADLLKKFKKMKHLVL